MHEQKRDAGVFECLSRGAAPATESTEASESARTKALTVKAREIGSESPNKHSNVAEEPNWEAEFIRHNFVSDRG